MKTTKRAIKPLVFAMATASSGAATINYGDFSDVSLLSITGAAHQRTSTDGEVLRLTNATDFNSGYAWTVGAHGAATFSTQFQFRITNPGSGFLSLLDDPEPGGDGIFFRVGNGGVDEPNSFEIWFDTWGGRPDSPSSNAIRVNQGGATISLVDASADGMRFDDGTLWTAWIDFAGGDLEVRASNTGSRPVDALLSTSDLMASTDPMHLGFYSFTGGAWGNHDVVNWTYNGAVPEPSTCLLAGCGVLLLLVKRDRN